MKASTLFITLFALAIASTRINAEENKPAEASKAVAENKAFCVGEKLIYGIDWGIFTVGRAVMEVKEIEKVDGHDCYHIISEAHTTGLGDILYRVRSTTETWLDVEDLCARK